MVYGSSLANIAEEKALEHLTSQFNVQAYKCHMSLSSKLIGQSHITKGKTLNICSEASAMIISPFTIEEREAKEPVTVI